MSDSNRKKILVALDGSEQSNQALRYLADLLPKQAYDLTLCHVTQVNPWKTWALKKDASQEMERELQLWLRDVQGVAEKLLLAGKKQLVEWGFDSKNVHVEVIPGEAGVAWDLINHVQNGDYIAVVAGRKGLSPFKDVILGSTADRLVDKLTGSEVWVVGGKPRGDKVLVAMDGSEGSMRAAEYVGLALGGADAVEICLYHAIMNTESFRTMAHAYLPPDFEQRWIEDAEQAMGKIMDEAVAKLVEAGIPRSNITTKMTPNVPSRAWAITQEAEEGGYGTIVTGRRGLSQIEEIFLGRVSKKVLHVAKNQAVWVVS